MPWRKEIEEGIRDSAKTVLFVDQAYLLSFNCLQVHSPTNAATSVYVRNSLSLLALCFVRV